MADVSHGSVFATSQFKRLQSAIPKSSMATFANCRFDATSQKYMTVWYTNDAAAVLDKLNEAEYQCNHPPGTHQAVAGGRDAYGFWLSTDTAHYMPGLCTKLGMAFTLARTGDPTPLSRRRQSEQAAEINSKHGTDNAVLPAKPSLEPGTFHDDGPSVDIDPAITPRKILFGSTPAGSLAPTPPSPIRPATAVNLGPGVPTSPNTLPRQDMRSREVRTSVRHAREARERPETILESVEEGDAPYTSFAGSPSGAWGSSHAAEMEATVASLVYDSHADDITPGFSNITNWIDFTHGIPDNASRVANGKFVFEATIDQINSVIDRGGIDDKTHATLTLFSPVSVILYRAVRPARRFGRCARNARGSDVPRRALARSNRERVQQSQLE